MLRNRAHRPEFPFDRAGDPPGVPRRSDGRAVGGARLPAVARQIVERVHIASTCDGPEIREIIAAVMPKELYFFGPYAKRYVEELGTTVPVIKPLFVNDQPTLF